MDFLNKYSKEGDFWQFKQIPSHQGPSSSGQLGYYGSPSNVQGGWGESIQHGEVTEKVSQNTTRLLDNFVVTVSM